MGTSPVPGVPLSVVFPGIALEPSSLPCEASISSIAQIHTMIPGVGLEM